MTVNKAYEVRVQREQDWQIEAILDDEALAVAAARKMEARAARADEKMAVVVVQEIHDIARNHLKGRSVYRGSSDAIARSEPGVSSDKGRGVQAHNPSPSGSGGAGTQMVNLHHVRVLSGVAMIGLATYAALQIL